MRNFEHSKQYMNDTLNLRRNNYFERIKKNVIETE